MSNPSPSKPTDVEYKLAKLVGRTSAALGIMDRELSRCVTKDLERSIDIARRWIEDLEKHDPVSLLIRAARELPEADNLFKAHINAKYPEGKDKRYFYAQIYKDAIVLREQALFAADTPRKIGEFGVLQELCNYCLLYIFQDAIYEHSLLEAEAKEKEPEDKKMFMEEDEKVDEQRSSQTLMAEGKKVMLDKQFAKMQLLS